MSSGLILLKSVDSENNLYLEIKTQTWSFITNSLKSTGLYGIDSTFDPRLGVRLSHSSQVAAFPVLP